MKKIGYCSAFSDDILSFLDMKTALGYSYISYAPALRTFDRLCSRQFPDDDTVTREIFRAFTDSESLCGASKNRQCYVLNAFSRYQIALGKDAYICCESHPEKKHEAYVFTDEELAALFCAAGSLKPTVRNDVRHLVLPAMLRVMYCCGLRPNEARNIRLCDVSLHDRTIVIHLTKDREDRIVLMGKDLALLIACYISDVSRLMPKMEYLFENPHGGPFSSDWLRQNFRRLVKDAGLENHGGSFPRPYDLRHTFATNTIRRWLENGMDVEANLPYLRAYLGHSSIEATMYYVHSDPATLMNTGFLDWEENGNE